MKFGTVVARRGLAALLVGLILGLGSPARAESPTYYRDVAGILQKNCQDCHRDGQVAPFSLLTYQQAKKRAGDLVEVTSKRFMPPWQASTTYGGPFHDQRGLEDAEIATLREWAEGGCPEGNPADAPPTREFAGDWPLGPPDLILSMAESFEVPANGADRFRIFVLKTDFPDTRWIKGVDYKPGSRKVVHHIFGAIDTSGLGLKLDAADPGPGFESEYDFGEGISVGPSLPIYTSGSRPRFAPEGMGYVLPPKADILIQVHYHPTGKAAVDRTEVGLYLSDKPLPKPIRSSFVFPEISKVQEAKLVDRSKAVGRDLTMNETFEDVLVIPADEPNYVIKGTSGSGMLGKPFSREILLTSVTPHMHWRGKSFEMHAVLPDEKQTQVPLIKIDHWDFNWQGSYYFVEPVKLPKGSYFEFTGRFDNSASNPVNPIQPPKVVHWNNRGDDEMCTAAYQYIVAEANAAPPKPQAKPDSGNSQTSTK